jgi:type I restriction enzyme S subunit
MAGEWTTLPLEDCMAAIIDYRGKSPEKTTFGVPLVTAKIVKGGRIEKPEEFIAEADFDDWMRRGMPKPGDIVMTTEAPLGEVAQLDGRKVALAQRVITLRGKPDILDNTFLKFLLQSNPVQEELRSRGTGTTVLGIRQSELRKVSLTLPPLAEQKAIAAVLGALDDKIELNRRMNATLEAMARALFQSWFVDFDPVRAKLDGRPPAALDPATAALFPEHLEDSPLGHIPTGWTAGTVVEGFNLTMGQSPPGDTYNDDGNGLPFYQGRTDFGFRFPKRRIYCTAPTRYAKLGDTLVSVRAPVGDINMANEDCCIGRGVAAVRHKSGAASFTYHSMANLYPGFARFEADGTVFGSINKDSFEKLPFVIPPDDIVAAYERQAGPLDEHIRILENQSRTLATLRDTLMPKLLSGEITL